MSDNSKKIEIDLEKERAQIVYATSKGKVKVSFYHDESSQSDGESDSESLYLIAEVQSKSKFDLWYKEIASARKEVYYSFTDGRNNNYGSKGNKDFSYNMENVMLTHDNPELTKIIQQAQKDVAECVPEEKQRLQNLKRLEEQKIEEIRERKKAEQRKKENVFAKTFEDLFQR